MKNMQTNATTYRSFVIIISHVIIPVHLKTWSKTPKDTQHEISYSAPCVNVWEPFSQRLVNVNVVHQFVHKVSPLSCDRYQIQARAVTQLWTGFDSHTGLQWSFSEHLGLW